MGKRSTLIRFLFQKQDGICFYCEREMTLKKYSPRSVTKDHKIPKARGGTDARSNIVGACYRCNNLKGDLTIEEFLDKYRDKEMPERDNTPKTILEKRVVRANLWRDIGTISTISVRQAERAGFNREAMGLNAEPLASLADFLS